MTDRQTFKQRIAAQGVLPLYHHPEEGVAVAIACALYRGGLTCIEYTNRGSQALSNFTRLVELRESLFPDAVLAAGTIRNGTDAEAFVDAGADVLISPVFEEGVADIAKRYRKLWIPGCMTPTEMHRASRAGFRMVKLFPGNLTGPGYLESIKPVLPEVEVLVTGGVEPTVESLGAWFRSGAMAVGMGSRLIPAVFEATDGELESLERRARQLTEMVREARPAT